MSALSSTNVFLDWLAGAGDPPFPVQRGPLDEAIGRLHRRLNRQARRFLKQPPNLQAYLALMTTDRHLRSLKYWVEMAGPYHGRRTEQALIRTALDMDDHYLRFWRRHAEGRSPFYGHLLKLRRKLARAKDDRWNTWIDAGLVGPASTATVALEKDIERLTLQIQRREARYGSRLARQGGLLFKQWPGLADNPAVQDEARRAAMRRQERGFLVYANEEPGLHLMECSPRAAVRQQVWERQQNQVQVRVQDIEKMRRLRQQVAEQHGQADHASLQMSGTALLVPRRAERLLERSLDILRGPLARAIRRGEARYGLEPGQAHNTRFAVVAGTHGKGPANLSDQAFPWRATAVKAICELMGLGGWQCLSAPKSLGRDQRRMLQFNFRHQDGRRAQVWYAPYTPSMSPNSQVAAQACMVRHVLHDEEGVVRVCTLDHHLPADRDHFLMDDLQTLCHEMGHILHFLALPGNNPYEPEQLTDDFVELPSILLERYYRDPETLMRWLSNKAPDALRQRRYWVRQLALHPMLAHQHQRKLWRAYLDLRLNRNDAGTFEETIEACQPRLPAPLHPKERTHLNYFDWSGLSAMNISHLAGEALAHQLVPLNARGQVTSTQVGDAFVSLLQVLARGITAHKVSRAWRQWRGRTMIRDLDEGFEAMSRAYAHQLRNRRH